MPRPWQSALDRLAAQERQFLEQEFLAPVVRGGRVQVRIAGVICTLRIQPANFTGFGVFRPQSTSDANLVRTARLAERQRYLEMFPQLRLIVLSMDSGASRAVAAQWGDARFEIRGAVALEMTEEVQVYDTVLARYDGGRFWFESLDPRADPAAAAYLRRSLGEMLPPDDLERSGLTAEQRAAYAIHYLERLDAQEAAEQQRLAALRNSTEERLRSALVHAGARLEDYLERSDHYQVSYTVDGVRHFSSVDKRDLTIQSAGICLSGRDADFDLASLVGVLRES